MRTKKPGLLQDRAFLPEYGVAVTYFRIRMHTKTTNEGRVSRDLVSVGLWPRSDFRFGWRPTKAWS